MYTKTGAQWKLAGLLHGFISQTEVLQVEWALQHPRESRHFKESQQSAKHDLAGIIGNLLYFTTAKKYEHLWVTFHELPAQTCQQLQIQRKVDLHCSVEPDFFNTKAYQDFKQTNQPRRKIVSEILAKRRKKINSTPQPVQIQNTVPTIVSQPQKPKPLSHAKPLPRLKNQQLIAKYKAQAEQYKQFLQQL